MKIFFGFVILFFSLIRISYASFEITEIMYDLEGTDANREWIEVRNTGSEADDLSAWYLFSANTKHALVPQGASLVPSQGYAVITQNVDKFKADWPNYTGFLFDSSWSGFNNETGTIALKDPSLAIIGEVLYSSSLGGAGDGNSLQKISGGWKGGAPTLGDSAGPVGESSESETDDSSDESKNTASSSTSSKKEKEKDIPRISTEITSSTTAIATLEFPVSARTLGYSGEPLVFGRFVWNFGDGMIREEKDYRAFTYVYSYPGEYIVSLSYYQNFLQSSPIATDRITVKVIAPDVAISSVGADSNPFIELENKSTIEIPLSRWIIAAAVHSFVIPDGMVILPGKKVKFSPRVTGFTSQDTRSVTLFNPSRETISFYPSTTLPEATVASTSDISIERKGETYADNAKATLPETLSKSEEPLDLNNLSAALHGGTPQEPPRSIFAWVGFACIVVVGLASAVFIRRKKLSENNVDKEEGIKDIAITE
ncbi:MAG: lamin tail domain-containing protein [Patescibacteria group bacterium]